MSKVGQTLVRTAEEHWQKARSSARLLSYVFRNKKLFVFGVIFLVISTIIDTVFPLLLVQIFSIVSQGENILQNPTVVGLILLYLLGAGIHYISEVTIGTASEQAVRDLRTELYQHLHTLSLRYFIEHQTGELLSRLSNDISHLQKVVMSTFTGLVRYTLTIVGILIVLWFTLPRIAVALPLLLVPVAASSMLLGVVMSRVSSRIQGYLAAALGFAENALRGIKTVRINNREIHELEIFSTTLNASYTEAVRLIRISSGASTILNVIGRLATVGIFLLIGQAALRQTLSIEQTILLLFYAALLWGALDGWMWVYLTIQTTSGATEQVFSILSEEPDIRDLPDAPELTVTQGALHFKAVDFAYEPHKPILRNVNLEISAGETLALVGTSGEGKTTFLSLICRFIEPDAGSIMIDSIDIGHVTQQSLRQQIGAVFQEPFLFPTTILENIKYGNEYASHEEIIEAAMAAGAHSFIEKMLEGYSTSIGSDGLRLSTGQRQRIALARMLLARPRIVLLDEVTSALDSETERTVMEALRTTLTHCTVIVVSHRLSTVRYADRIAVLHEGTIAEAGTHDELMTHDGPYRALFDVASTFPAH